MKTPYPFAKSVFCSVAIASLFVTGTIFGAATIWNDSSTDFNASTSWSAGSPAGNNVAWFTTAFGTNQPTLTADISTAGLLFQGAGTSGWNVGGAFTLTLTGSSLNGSGGLANNSANALRGENVSGTNTVSANIVLASALTSDSYFLQVAGGTLAVNGNILASSTSALVLRNGSTNGGVIQLSGDNTYTTGTTIDTSAAGLELDLGNDNALGTGALNVNAPATIVAIGGARTIPNAVTFNSNSTIGGSTPLTINGTVTSGGFPGSPTITINNTATTTFAGDVFISNVANQHRQMLINGTGNLNITGVVSNGIGLSSLLQYLGSGTLTLSNANTYSNGTIVAGGTVVGNHDGAFGSGSVTLNAANVTLTLQNGAVNNYIADNATLTVGFTSDVVNLNYIGTDVVAGLTVNNVTMGAGVYGSFNVAEFVGTGTITVVPEPPTYLLLSIGLLIFAPRLRRALR